jgi:phenylpropionate dioxygenase-like ring-hydroxylating dioxygenase large terminal subunit
MAPDERELLERLKRVLESGRNEGLDATFSVAASEYVDAALHTREMAALRRRPLPLLPADAVAPGSRVLRERMGVALIVTRDLDGRVHVLKNRCRHRGAALVDEECSTAQRLVCPYHGWSYGLDGKLLHVPEREHGFPGLDDEAASLHRIPCIEWAGVIWIGGDSDEALAATLRSTRDEPELSRLSRTRALDARRWTGEFNWKLGVNAFLETYHFKVAHTTGIAPHFVWNRLLIDPLGEHLRLSLPRTSLLKRLESLERVELRTNVSYVYFIFPCSFISVLPDHASFITFLPDGLTRTQVESHLFVPAESLDEKREYWDKNAALFAQTIREDLALAASIQKGIDAEPTDHFTFATFEHGIAHFRSTLERLL